MTTNAPGRKFLLVTGILFIVFNAIGALLTPMTLMTIDFWLPMFGGEAMRGTWTLIYVGSIILSLFAVLVGILGVAFSNKVEKGGLLVVLAVVTVVSSVVYNIVYTVNIMNYSGEMGIGTIVGIPISLVLPILFIIGAMKNKKVADGM